MDSQVDLVIAVAREALFLVLICSAPPLLAALAVGLFTGLVQAATGVQEQSLSLVPKILAVSLSLVLAGPWMGAQLTRFTQALLTAIAGVGQGG